MKANFGILIYNGAEELDIIGPWEIIKIWSEKFGGPDKVFTVAEKPDVITCIHGLKLIPDYHFANCPKLDYLLVAGGPGRKIEVNNKTLIDFIRDQAKSSQYILSVCTGAFLLNEAGLLNNRKATTYWTALPELKQFPEIKIVEERFVTDGNLLTSAGVSSGIDLALALIAKVAGENVAGKVQLAAEYFPPKKMYAKLAEIENLPKYLKKKPKSKN